MAAPKSPGRDAFDKDLAEITDDIPATYTNMVQLFRPDFEAERIRQTRFGKRVDFPILDELKKIVKIRRESQKKYLKK